MEGFAYYAKIKPLPPTNVVRTILFCRDEYRCAYCQIAVTYKSGTRDHVVPKYQFRGKSRGEATVWTNCVVSCEPCNTRKGNRSLSEMGMKPKVRPIMPDYIRLDHHGKIHSIQPQLVAAYFKVNLETNEVVEIDTPPKG